MGLRGPDTGPGCQPTPTDQAPEVKHAAHPLLPLPIRMAPGDSTDRHRTAADHQRPGRLGRASPMRTEPEHLPASAFREAPASLETLETSSHGPMPPTLTTPPEARPKPHAWPAGLPQQTELQDAIHEPHQDLRDRILEALATAAIEDLRKTARTMAGCAASVHLYVDSAAGTVHESVHRCKSRLCPFCARARTAHVAEQMQRQVDAMKHPRHLVLTVKSRGEPLGDQLHDLRTWFARFRRTPFWKDNVFGGVYTLEITVNEKTGLWHPHLHILFDGNFLPFKLIQKLWHEITGGSEIVWIEEVWSRDGAVRELTKYIGKPQKAKHWTDAQIREYALTIKGARMVQTFGKTAGPPIADQTPEDPHPSGVWHISVSRLVYMAGRDNELAVKTLPLVADRWPHLARYIYGKMPQLEPDKSRTERMLAAFAAIESGKAPPRYAHAPPQDPAALEKQIAAALDTLREREEIREHDTAHLTQDAE